MEFDEFQALAEAAFEAIPPEFREGIDGLVVRADAEAHPEFPDIYTLGYCQTESYPSDWVGPDTTRSTILLYFGSFQAVAKQERDFDWEAEIYETVEHEVRHHVESLAGTDGLADVDYAMDEGFRRARGEPFDPFYYQQGEDLGRGLFQVEDQFFLEVPWESGGVEFYWRGARYEVPGPPPEGDVHFIWIEGLDAGPGGLELVLVRKRGAMGVLRDLFKRRPPEVKVWEAEAEPADGPEPRNGPAQSGS